jgi:hypothetical protein
LRQYRIVLAARAEQIPIVKHGIPRQISDILVLTVERCGARFRIDLIAEPPFAAPPSTSHSAHFLQFLLCLLSDEVNEACHRE